MSEAERIFAAITSVSRSAQGQADEINRLRALLAEAEKVLEPFATMGRLIDGPYAPSNLSDDKPYRSGGAWRDRDGKTRFVTWGDFRAARDLAAKLRASPKEGE